jgi:hypothetical protein
MAVFIPSTESMDDLAALRDGLKQYLAAAEENAAAISGWFADNREKTILFHHQLVRALDERDDKKAAALIPEMGDIAGTVLSLQDFPALAERTLGRQGAFQKTISHMPPAFPPDLVAPLPEILLQEMDVPASIENVRQALATEDENKQQGLSGLFHRKEKRRHEETIGTLHQMRALQQEIVSLPAERHYYIDGVMDWLADRLEPANDTGCDPSAMLQYCNPSYIIGRMRGEYEEKITAGVTALREPAQQYSLLASAIDKQDLRGIVNNLGIAYPRNATPESEMFKRILLADYKAADLRELILTHIDRPQQQALAQEIRRCVPGALPPLRQKTLFQQVATKVIDHLLGPGPQKIDW